MTVTIFPTGEAASSRCGLCGEYNFPRKPTTNLKFLHNQVDRTADFMATSRQIFESGKNLFQKTPVSKKSFSSPLEKIPFRGDHQSRLCQSRREIVLSLQRRRSKWRIGDRSGAEKEDPKAQKFSSDVQRGDCCHILG